MKKLLLAALVSFLYISAFSQGPPFPNYQQQGSPTIRWQQFGAVQATKGLINGVFADTLVANLTSWIDFYPGAQIFTTNDTSIWVRNNNATKWIKNKAGSVNITSFTFTTDSTITICFGDGTCITIPINNFTNIVNNVIQNFTDSSVIKINDSTYLFCNAAGSCDTVHLGNSNTYYFISADTLVTCDTVQIICDVPDSCYQQQLCDTIVLGQPVVAPVYQNLLRRLPFSNNIIEGGSALGDYRGSMVHDTWYYLHGNKLTLEGFTNERPLVTFDQQQWNQFSSSIVSFKDYGTYPPDGRIDSVNKVNLYINYTNPFMDDTTGFMHDRIGYLLIGNSRGSRASYGLDDNNSKQTGIMLHTLDTAYTDAVTIFGNQVSSIYPFFNGFRDSTLLNARIAVFHTDRSSNFLGKVYLTNGRLEPDTALVAAANNLTLGLGNVNIVSGATQINAITTSGWQAGSSPVYLVFSGAPLVKNNTAGGAGTATILLAGRTDFQAAAGDVLAILFDGTNWYETNRTLSGSVVSVSANNGASMSGIIVQLGQTVSAVGNPAILLHHTEIPMGGFTLSLNASATQSANIFQTKNAAAAIRARITSAADFSNTGGQTGGEKFGDGAIVSGANGIAFGNAANAITGIVIGAGVKGGPTSITISNDAIDVSAFVSSIVIGGIATGSNATAIGGSSSAGTTGSSFGSSALSSGSGSLALGANSQATAQNATAINGISAFTGSVAIGGTTTATNQFVLGQPFGTITDMYLGAGVTSTTANLADIILHATGGSGSNIGGAALIFAGGKGTGTGIPGDVASQTSLVGSTGSTLQTLGDRDRIVGKYTTLTESAATSFVRVNIPSNSVAGGEVWVTIEANDATDFQSRTLSFLYTAVNKAGTTTITIETPREVVAISSGTLTVTITAVDSGTGNVDFQANAVSSLTQTALRANCRVNKNMGIGSISAQ